MEDIVVAVTVAIVGVILGRAHTGNNGRVSRQVSGTTSRYTVDHEMGALVPELIGTRPLNMATWDIEAQLQWSWEQLRASCVINVDSLAT